MGPCGDTPLRQLTSPWPRRHLPPEFVAAQRLRAGSNVMLQVPPPAPKQRLGRAMTLGGEGANPGKGPAGSLPASTSLPADAASMSCGVHRDIFRRCEYMQ